MKPHAIAGVLGLAVGLALAGCHGERKEVDPATGRPETTKTIQFYCGGSMSQPIKELVAEFEQAHPNVRVKTIYNGCGFLVSQMKAAHDANAFVGDMYYACDTSFMHDAEGYQVVDPSYPAVRITRFFPVLMVKKGNPLNIKTVEDLARPEVTFIAMGRDDGGAVGRVGFQILKASPKWSEIEPKIKYLAPTADMLATAVAKGQAQVAVIWHVVAKPYVESGDADMIYIEGEHADQPIALLKGSKYPELAKELILFIRSPHGQQVFRKYGFVIDEPTTRPD
ncbi:MAG: hypothetical protein BIFFINMI_01797 [Phycisphaerae bacterium]|nr:hypothetical protein [Phycisphaerae bacterium]